MTTQSSEILSPEAEPRSRPRWGRILAWAGLAVLLALVGVKLIQNQQGPVSQGQVVPDFTLTTFDDQSYRLSDLRGQVVLINFWASWCKPCEQEAADLQAAWEAYAPGGEVVFLGVDYVDTEPEAKGYLEKFGITYPNGPDLRTKISQAFRIRGVPETYVIDREGRLQGVKIGPYSSLAEIKAMIDPLLAP